MYFPIANSNLKTQNLINYRIVLRIIVTCDQKAIYLV